MSRLLSFSIILMIASSAVRSTTSGGSSMLDCDFEWNTTCDWKTSRSFKVDRVDQVLKKNTYMPYHDHTIHSLSGHFVYISQSEPTRINGWLEANNPFDGGNDSEICFTFAYYFYAMQPSIMSLHVLDGNRNMKIYQMNSANLIRWEEIRVPINLDQFKNFKVETFSFIVTIAQGVLAIDDIRVFRGNCGAEERDFCDFEIDQSCALFSPVHNSSLVTEWTVREGNNLSMVDHTIHTKGGHFYGVDVGSMKQRNGKINDYLIQSQPYGSSVCLRFSYFIGGYQSDARLFVGLRQNNRISKVWQVSGSTGEMWLTHQHRIESTIDLYPYYYEIIMGIETNDVNQDDFDKVFVDDVSVVKTSYCSQDGRCDFEDGDMCLLEPIMVGHQSLSPDRKNLLTQTKNYTGLSVQDYLNANVDVGWHVFSPYQSNNFINRDATTGEIDGKYLLLTGRNRFDRGIFATGRYAIMELQQKSLCLSFSIYQPSEGTILEIYQSEPLLGTEAMKIWDHRNRSASWYGNDWKTFEVYAQVQNQSSTDMFFYFVGTIGHPSSYIALDDFIVKEKCENPSNENHHWSTTTLVPPTKNPEDYFQCLNGTYIPIEERCNWIDDCSQGEDEQDCGSCHFQTADQICDYKIFKNDGYSFHFSANRPDDIGPPDGPTGPFYMIAYGSFQAKNRSNIHSSLISPTIRQTYTESCAISFYYHSNDAKDGQLSLMLGMEDIGESVPVWQSKAQPLEDYQWIPILIDLHRIKHPFKLIFSSQPGRSASTFQAVGDIYIGGCHPDPPSPNDQCSDGQFKCWNRVCISKQYVCDLEDDCGDASDEIACDPSKVTDFEQNFGLWGREYILNWRIIQARYSGKDLRKAPSYDHTTGLSTGHYLFTTEQYSNSPVAEHRMAEIPSPRFMAIKPNCALRFFLFKNSKNSTLMVEKLVISKDGLNASIEILDQITNHSEAEFVKFVYNFNQSSNDVYQIRLAAQLDHLPNAFLRPYLAIDDISFSENCTMIEKDPCTTTTQSPPINPKDKNYLKIFFAIIIPILIIVGIWITIKTCLRYKKRTTTFKAISMRTLQRSSTITDKI